MPPSVHASSARRYVGASDIFCSILPYSIASSPDLCNTHPLPRLAAQFSAAQMENEEARKRWLQGLRAVLDAKSGIEISVTLK